MIDKTILASLCKERFKLFFETVSGFELADAHTTMVDFWMDNNDCLVLAPRKIAKSTILVYYFACWLLTKYPNISILIISQKLDGAKQAISAIKRILESSSYTDLFGYTIDTSRTNTATSINVKRSMDNVEPHPSVCAASANGAGQVTGKRTHVVLCDDIVGIENCTSKDTREIVDFLETTVFPTMHIEGDADMPTYIKFIGTRYSPSDLYDSLMNAGNIPVLTLQAILDPYTENERSIWEEGLPLEKLRSFRTNYTVQAFASQYMNSTLEMELANPLNISHIQKAKEVPSDLIVHIGCDVVGGDSPGGDEFALCVAGKHRQSGKAYVLDFFHRRLDFDAQVETIIQYARLYSPHQVNIEGFGQQGAFISHIRNTTNVPVVKQTPKGSKLDRLLSLTPHMLNEKILFADKPVLREFIDQWINFGRTGYHDDMCDSFYLAVCTLLTIEAQKPVFHSRKPSIFR